MMISREAKIIVKKKTIKIPTNPAIVTAVDAPAVAFLVLVLFVALTSSPFT